MSVTPFDQHGFCWTMLDERKPKKPLKTLDELPSISGLTQEEIEKTLEENKVVTKEAVWTEYYGDSIKHKEDFVNIDILMPTGLILPTLCPMQGSLSHLKQTVYKYMKKLPFGEDVKDISFYVFATVSIDGEMLEVYDEARSVASLDMFLPILSLIEPKDVLIDKKMTKDIGRLLSLDFDRVEKCALTEELRNFRYELFNASLRGEQERGTEGVLHYEFPEETILPNVGDRSFSPNAHSEVHEEDLEFWWFPNLPADANRKAMERLKKKVERSKNGLQVWYSVVDATEYNECLNIRDIFEKTPTDIIKQTLNELGKHHENPADFILQVAGKRTFITRNLKIIRYEHVRSCFENYRQPILLMRRKHAVFAEFDKPPPIFTPFYARASDFRKRFPLLDLPKPRCFWELDANMCISLFSISNIVVDEVEKKLYLLMAVSVGRHILQERRSEMISPAKPRWSIEDLKCLIKFNLYLKELPESAQLSCTLIQVVEDRHEPVSFVNIRLFDWKGRYVRGRHSYCMWPFPPLPEVGGFLNLLGTHGQNHNTKAIRLEIEIYDDNKIDESQFPDWSMIEKYAEYYERLFGHKRPPVELEPITRDSEIFKRFLHYRLMFDGSKLSDEDQFFLWDARFKIQELFPQMILCLADCPMIYREREYLCEFYTLLNDWPQLYVDTAMELLDVRFPDRYVRAFAIRHLDKCLDNDQLLIYLLPLVQALKYEPYANSPLADMLIRRSIMDYRIGHTFFWLICSELAMFLPEEIAVVEKAPVMYLRLCLLAEAYCRGNASHISSMIKQKEMIQQLSELSKMVKNYSLKDMASKKLRSKLIEMKVQLENMPSPLNPCCRLGELLIDKCRVMASAKMPIKMCWKNQEPLCEFTSTSHEILFKNGDDLRQDLLTLQVMRIFDAKWKNYNLDYCLTLYEVLPMGQNIGMINVVHNCHTIFQIQCSSKQISSSIGIDQRFLNKFLYDVCSKDKELNSKQYISY